MTTITENREIMIQKNLLKWWSEETECVFQRIERWMAFARGYNRLRSLRWLKNQQTIQESWNMSSDKLHGLKQSRWKSSPEEIKINCCGTFNYQSNSKLDSNCLETYQYDHSIYFKTIGDIKSIKRHRNQNQDSTSISSEEQIEWDASSLTNPIFKLSFEETNNVSNTVAEQNRVTQNTWSIMDVSKFDLNLIDYRRKNEWFSRSAGDRGRDRRQTENNSMIFLDGLEDKMDKEDQEDGLKNQKETSFGCFEKLNNSSRT